MSAFLCTLLGVSLAFAPWEAACAQTSVPAPAPSDAPATPGDSAQISQSLLTAGQPRKCERVGADGAIVVCGGREANERERLPLRGELDSARATNDGLPRAPNVFGIKQGGMSVSGCFLPPCPPPLMQDIDFAALPEAPPDSDADKIARGEIRAP